MSAATLSDDTPVDPDDELLVAYLDGELDRKDQAALENRLMEEETLRQRLQQLQTGWDLLESLPDPTPSLQLVESTLEMVVADIVKQEPPRDSLWNRFQFPILIAAACLFGVIAVSSVAALNRHRSYQAQLRDLAIVENLDAYMYGSDLTLMRQLQGPDWLNMVSAAQEIGDIRVNYIANIAQTPIDQRDELVRNLPPEKMDQLDSRWERFTRLDEAQREQLRRTAKAVALQPDSESLLRTMQAYAIWRENLPAAMRDAIETGEGQDQRNAITQAVDYTQISISRRSSMKLNEEAFDAIYVALRQVLDERLNNDDPALLSGIERLPDEFDREFFLIARIAFAGSFRGIAGRGPSSRGPGSRGGPSGAGGPGGERVDPLSPDELELIRWVLPDRAMQILDVVAVGDPLIESMTLRAWAEETVRRKFPSRRNESTLLERYLELPEADRDVIDLMPPKQFLNELSRDVGRFPR